MTVRVTCAVSIDKATTKLADKIRELGVNPIITCAVVRAVYEGPDEALARKIVELFKQEDTSDIYFDFGGRRRKR